MRQRPATTPVTMQGNDSPQIKSSFQRIYGSTPTTTYTGNAGPNIKSLKQSAAEKAEAELERMKILNPIGYRLKMENEADLQRILDARSQALAEDEKLASGIRSSFRSMGDTRPLSPYEQGIASAKFGAMKGAQDAERERGRKGASYTRSSFGSMF